MWKLAGQVMDRIAVAVITWNWEYGRFEFKDQDSRGLVCTQE